jgi:hypothetical protein
MAATPYQREWKRLYMMRQRHGALWEVVWLRDGGRCVECGSTQDIEIDHIIPLSQGGKPHDPDNQQLLCKKCNLAKQTSDGARFKNYRLINDQRKQRNHIKAIQKEGG